MKVLRGLLLLGALLAFAPAADAATCEGTGVSHADTATVNGKTLVLNGMGIREATVMNINVYVGALYMPAKTQDASKVINDDVEKQIVLKFVRDVDKSDVTKAWTDSITKNGGLPTYQAQLDQLNGWMQDMKTGDSMTYTYVPGTGLKIKVNSSEKGTIAGAEFMKLFFKIWFADPPNQGLKDGMLGKIKCED